MKKAPEFFIGESFNNVNEARIALIQIKYCNLSSSGTSVEEAYSMCYQLVTVLARCDKLLLSTQDQKNLTSYLILKGCCKSNYANQNLVTSSKLAFPFSILDNLLDASPNHFNENFHFLVDGGKKSLASMWLYTEYTHSQKLKSNKVENQTSAKNREK